MRSIEHANFSGNRERDARQSSPSCADFPPASEDDQNQLPIKSYRSLPSTTYSAAKVTRISTSRISSVLANLQIVRLSSDLRWSRSRSYCLAATVYQGVAPSDEDVGLPGPSPRPTVFVIGMTIPPLIKVSLSGMRPFLLERVWSEGAIIRPKLVFVNT